MHVHQHLLHPLLFFTQETHKRNVVLIYFDKNSCAYRAHREEKKSDSDLESPERKKDQRCLETFSNSKPVPLKSCVQNQLSSCLHVRQTSQIMQILKCEFGIRTSEEVSLNLPSILDHCWTERLVWPTGFMLARGLTVQQCRGPRPDPFMQSRQSRGRPSNTKCLINLIICLQPQGMKSLFPRHLRPRAASAKLLTHTCTRAHTRSPAIHYLAYLRAVVRIKSHP